MLPVLKDTDQLSLCVYERDLLCSCGVTEKVVKSIEISRKVLLVVSNVFAVSQWHHLETTFAKHNLQDKYENAFVFGVARMYWS